MIYTKLADQKSIDTAVSNLEKNNIHSLVVDHKNEALEQIKKMIPKNSSVMNGSSATLEQIGYIDYLKEGNHGWNNLHETILKEQDPAKQAQLRKQSVISDFYLGSVHALTETGEFVVASNTGSQLPHLVYTSPNIILVVSTKKIVPTLSEGVNRVEQQVFPLEDARLRKAYNVGTYISKLLIFKYENPGMKRNVTLILVKEDLGF